MINPNNIDVIIFDFGGTLDTDGIHWSIKFWDTYQKFQIPVSHEQFREAYINTEPEVKKFIKKDDNLVNTLSIQILLQLKYLKEKSIYITDDEKKVADKFAEYCFKDVTENIRLIRPQLKELNERYKLALVSNFYGNVVTVCKHLNILQYFVIIVDSSEVGISKPDPEIFNMALKKLNAIPDKSVVIGDSYSRDILPAKKLGCKTIWLNGKSYSNTDNTEDADLIINSIKDISRIFKTYEVLK